MRGNDSSPLKHPGKHEFFLVAQELRTIRGEHSPNRRNDRRTKRETRTISISVQPLDEDFQAVEDPFWVVSRDISPKGLGLICHDPIEHEYVRIGLLNEKITAIGRIRHNTPIGETYPLYLVGIEFLQETDFA
jgi:hypothetical protein